MTADGLTSVYTITATRALDDAEVLCTMTWNQVATAISDANTLAITAESATLYSKRELLFFGICCVEKLEFKKFQKMIIF